MTLSTIISITITLTFIYLALSIVTSEVQEIIAKTLNLRAKHLEESIIHLLGEKAHDNDPKITKKLYEQYLTSPLSSSSEQNDKSTEISYVSPKKFANGLIETVKEILEYESKTVNFEDENSQEVYLQKVINDINNAPLPDKLKTDLTFLVQRANRKLTRTEKGLQYIEEEIQEWFNESMEFASERYKNKAKIISFILGIIIVITFNVDTINIVDKLSKGEVLVSVLNDAAVEVLKSDPSIASCQSSEKKSDIQTCISSIQDQLSLALDDINNLPIGWHFSDPLKEQFTPFNVSNIVNAVIGWSISAIAVSLGAPFWYAVLKNLVDFKSSQNKRSSS